MSLPDQFSETLSETAKRAADYLRGIGERRVAPTTDTIGGLKALAGPLPDSGASPDEILALLDNVAAPATIASTAGRYFGFVVGGTVPGALLASWLNVGYNCGIVLVREPKHLWAAMNVSAAYFPDDKGREPFQYTPELSRRARGVELWAALRSLGREGLADLIERTCRYARRMADDLQSVGYEILNEVVINQVLV